MSKRYDFKLTPAYCLYNGVAVLEQKGAAIRFLVENKDDELVCGRLSRAFENHIENIRRLKDYPEEFNRLIKIDFESGTRKVQPLALKKSLEKVSGRLQRFCCWTAY